MIVRRIRGGIEGFREGYAPVTLTPQTGSPISGVKKNEDLFSVQIMDTSERIQGYEKDKMKAVVNGVRRRRQRAKRGAEALLVQGLEERSWPGF